MIFCYVDRVAERTLKRVWSILINNPPGDPTDPILDFKTNISPYDSFKKLSDLPKREAMAKLRDYYKFMFVRNPINRLWSVYQDTLFLPPKWGSLGQRFHIPGESRGDVNRSAEEEKCANDVTFTDYIRKLINISPNAPSAEFSVPYPLLCDPCNVGYNYIGKLETFNSDLW